MVLIVKMNLMGTLRGQQILRPWTNSCVSWPFLILKNVPHHRHYLRKWRASCKKKLFFSCDKIFLFSAPLSVERSPIANGHRHCLHVGERFWEEEWKVEKKLILSTRPVRSVFFRRVLNGFSAFWPFSA